MVKKPGERKLIGIDLAHFHVTPWEVKIFIQTGEQRDLSQRTHIRKNAKTENWALCLHDQLKLAKE